MVNSEGCIFLLKMKKVKPYKLLLGGNENSLFI
jgi:hypothetical protein